MVGPPTLPNISPELAVGTVLTTKGGGDRVLKGFLTLSVKSGVP